MEDVRVVGDRANDARAQRPTSTPLTATQPTSMLSGRYIQNNIPPQSDYAQIVSIAPGVLAIGRNGSGNAFFGQVSVCGFQDGQETNNYQAGTSWQSRLLSISADVNYIDFSNMVASRNGGVNTIYFNQRAVDYYVCQRQRQLGQEPCHAPADRRRSRGDSGGIFTSGAIHASLIDNWVGSRYGDVGMRRGSSRSVSSTCAAMPGGRCSRRGRCCR